ncbi:MAG: 50S ribosomal protein L5 [Actinobacteria bacterium]|nr:MAG: 50S ribosomal protein L5 [Actinomycetota bacterium]
MSTNAQLKNKREKSRFKKYYEDEVVPAIMKDFGFNNRLQVPYIEKVIVNIGMGEASQEPKSLETAQNELSLITGQKPIVTKAKKSIAGFKIRVGQPVGLKVTLRGERMYEFTDRLITLAIPRMRDFRGFSRKSFDKFGNYSIGIEEQLIFPEVDYDKVDKIRGMDITFVTSTDDKDLSEALLEKMKFPFKSKK